MIRRSYLVLSLMTVIVAALPLARPAAAQQAAGTADLSQEPVLYEQLRTVVRFENDGTMRREQIGLVRVQTAQGVALAGELAFGYNSANERIHVVYVRVKKPDGSEVQVGNDAVRDLPLPIQQRAPEYSDYRVEHITVPDVTPGAEVAYDIAIERFAPLAPGQFWFEYTFSRALAARDEELEINLPQGRAVTLRTQPGYAAAETNAAGRTIYHWHPAAPTAAPAPARAASSTLPPPDVQLTTFPSWAAVGAWYQGLQQARLTLTPALRARAEQLTAGPATELGKIQALYDFVAKNIRYVSLSFGIGRYQPHAAAEVLANEYGDCKDQQTLLAALLAAVGIKAYPALVATQRTIDAAVPSPAQFDHVITAVPLSDGLIWMDTTPGVAPFRMLVASIRNTQALIIPDAGPAHLARTPANPPMPEWETTEITAAVDSLGKLNADFRMRAEGDSGLAMRVVLNAVPPAQWKDIGKAIVSHIWVGGEVQKTEASAPAATGQPFQLTFHIASDGYLNWNDQNAELALPRSMQLPEAGDSGAIKLGAPTTVTLAMSLQLPAGVAITAPVAVSMTRPYASYASRYPVHGTTLTVERRLTVTQGELAAKERDDYAAFRRAVTGDEEQVARVVRTAAALAPPPDAGAEELSRAGNAALDAGDYAQAVSLLTRAAAAPSPPPEVWNDIGRAYLDEGQPRQALAALQRQIALNPYDQYAYNNAGLAQWHLNDRRAAAEEFQKQIEINPLDSHAHANLGRLEGGMGQFAAAIPELRKAATITPKDASIHMMLGVSLNGTGAVDEAVSELEQAANLAAAPATWTEVGALLAENGRDPERAQQYAHQAIAALAATLGQAQAGQLKMSDVAQVAELARDWETLGLTKAKAGDAAGAVVYLQPAWQLLQGPIVGRALAEAYVQAGRKREATAVYAQLMAMEGFAPAADLPANVLAKLGPSAKLVQQRMQRLADQVAVDRRALAQLAGGENRIMEQEALHRLDLQNARTIQLPVAVTASGDAGLLLLLTPSESAANGAGQPLRLKVAAAQWISGDEALRGAAARLRGVATRIEIPPGREAPLVLHGLLSCEEEFDAARRRRCLVVLVPPQQDVRSLNLQAPPAAGEDVQVQTEQQP